MVEEKKKVSFKIHWFLSIKQTIKKTVKNMYVFVGISNFKIPLCIYYFLWRSLFDIGVRAPSDLEAVTFLPEKSAQHPNGWWLNSGCKRRRLLFSQLMKRLSLEK